MTDRRRYNHQNPRNDQIVAFLAQGMSISEIALRMNLRYWCIRDRIRDHGLDELAAKYDARQFAPDTEAKVWRFKTIWEREAWRRIGISLPRVRFLDGPFVGN